MSSLDPGMARALEVLQLLLTVKPTNASLLHAMLPSLEEQQAETGLEAVQHNARYPLSFVRPPGAHSGLWSVLANVTRRGEETVRMDVPPPPADWAAGREADALRAELAAAEEAKAAAGGLPGGYALAALEVHDVLHSSPRRGGAPVAASFASRCRTATSARPGGGASRRRTSGRAPRRTIRCSD